MTARRWWRAFHGNAIPDDGDHRYTDIAIHAKLTKQAGIMPSLKLADQAVSVASRTRRQRSLEYERLAGYGIGFARFGTVEPRAVAA